MTIRFMLILAGCLCAFSAPTPAQMIALQSPLQSTNDSFFDRSGFSWGLDIPGSSRVVGLMPNGQFTPDGSIPIRFGGLNSALPPFGGFNPGADTTLGLAWRRPGGGGGFFNMSLGQGSNQSIASVTPSLTLTNGFPGSIFDGQLRPFVTGVIPVVGANPGQPRPTTVSPLRSKIARLQAGEGRPVIPSTPHLKRSSPLRRDRGSSAQRGDVSLTEIRAAKAAARLGDTDQRESLLQRADEAENAGRLYAARQLLRQALKLTSPGGQSVVSAEIERITGKIESQRR